MRHSIYCQVQSGFACSCGVDVATEQRIAQLTEALEEAQRLLAFAGCPTGWIDAVLREGDGAATDRKG